MEPQRASQATLDDLLDRVLNKGIVVKLDLIIGVAGIPLIGISLQAAIAAVETMLDYGMMQAWDADTRAHADREKRRRQLDLQQGEHVVLDLYASYHHAHGISRMWRPGRLILTDRRLLLVRPAPWEVFIETPVTAITGIGRTVYRNLGGGEREIVCLALTDGTLTMLYTPQPDVLVADLREQCVRLGTAPMEIPHEQIGWLGPDAVADGQLWHRWSEGDDPAQWKSGWATLTRSELTWQGDAAREALRIPLTEIAQLTVVPGEHGVPGDGEVLAIAYGRAGRQTEAVFAGKEINAWPTAIRRAALAHEGDDDART